MPRPTQVMLRSTGLIILVGLAACSSIGLLGTGLALAAEPVPDTGFDRVSSPLVRNDLLRQTAASCAATACHGGPRAGTAKPSAARGSEYPLWIEQDPHAQSWKTICGPSSIAILERLNIVKAGQVVDRPAFDNCLACHNSTREQQQKERPGAEHFLEGVGCAACHGPSEKWRSTHYQLNWSSNASVDEGFVPAGNMLARARMCAACHVGDRDRDMNHDIIAAGHPALHYEFTSFHQRQPKHWRDPREADLDHFEASQWLVGQLAALDAALVLLEARANRALEISQWPELSNYDCSSCHRPLRPLDVSRKTPAARSTSARFSDWNRYGVEELLRLRLSDGHVRPIDQRLTVALKHLSSLMQSPSSTAQQTIEASIGARLALDQWIRSPEGITEIQNFSATRLRLLVLSAGNDQAAQSSWETAAQFYLASIAARRAWPPPSNPGRESEPQSTAKRLRDILTFPANSSSPRLFEFGIDGSSESLGHALDSHWRSLDLSALRPQDNSSTLPQP